MSTNNELEQKIKKLIHLTQRVLPIKVGNLAKYHFKENFLKGGFVNGGLQRWTPAKRLGSGDKSAAANHRTLMSERNLLYSSINYSAGEGRVKIFTDVHYAPIHNEGGVTHPTVTPKMRKFAWAKYFAAGGKTGKGENVPPEALKWKKLALTKKKKLNIRIPKRQFMGESRELTKKIQELVDKEVEKIFNT